MTNCESCDWYNLYDEEIGVATERVWLHKSVGKEGECRMVDICSDCASHADIYELPSGCAHCQEHLDSLESRTSRGSRKRLIAENTRLMKRVRDLELKVADLNTELGYGM